MLNYNEIRQKTYIEIDNEPYEVVSSEIFRKQKRKPVNQTKLKNLITGSVIERSFHQSDKVNEAELEKIKLKYLYKKGIEVWMSSPDNPKDRRTIPLSLIEGELNYIIENDVVDVLLFNDQIIGFKLPIKVSLIVVDSPPSIKGNTSSGGSKKITLETGAVVTTPLFIKAGDRIEVNTETGEYVGRVNEPHK